MGNGRFAAALLGTLLLARAGAAQAPGGLKAIEAEVEAQRKKLGIPGLALAIVKDDRVVFLKGFGWRDAAKKLPVTPDTLFAIGSSSKAFTAAALMQSVEQGKVRLGDHPRKHLPYFTVRDPEIDAKITVRDLLCHRSGFPRTDLVWAAGESALTRPQIIEAVCAAKPTAKLGAAFQYQNVMYAAAGEIVAGAQGMPYEQAVARRLFAPLGMKTANFSVPTTLRAPDHAVGYNVDAAGKAAPLPMRALTKIAPAGGINASAREMTAWVRLMLGEGVYEGKRLFSRASYAALTSPQMRIGGTVSYGLGWFLRDWKGHRVVEHGGNIDGFNAEVAFMPDRKIGLVLLTNVSSSPLAQGVQDIVWRNLVPVSKAPAPLPPAPAGPEVPAREEAGVYKIAGAPVELTIAFQDGKLTLSVPGQPAYPLERLSGRRYKLGAPAPDGFFATFRPGKDPKRTDLFLEQPQGNGVFTRDAATPFAAPLTAEVLIEKAVAALGGEKWKAHARRHVVGEADFENQGIRASVDEWAEAPCRSGGRTELTALGRPLGWIREWFDGARGGQTTSFGRSMPVAAKEIASRRVRHDFYDGLRDPKTAFAKVEIVGQETLGDAAHGIAPEPCYLLRLTPADGAPLTLAVSVATARIVRREAPGAPTEFYGDWREVDGVLAPFLRVAVLEGGGAAVFRARSVAIDPPVDPKVFAP